MKRTIFVVAIIAIAGCTSQTSERQPLAVTPPGERADAAVVRTPLPAVPPPTPPAVQQIPGIKTEPAAPLAVLVPPGAIYVCVSGSPPQLLQTAIEFAPHVGDLCRKHPEMGPCQYEREACRRSGGRVFAADGSEITRGTEDEYDKRVMRIRLRSN